MSIPTMFGVAQSRGQYRDVSKTLLGAQQYATRRGIREVYQRVNGSCNIQRVAVRVNSKWVNC